MKKKIVIGIIAILVLIMCGGAYYTLQNAVSSTAIIEAGEDLEVSTLAKMSFVRVTCEEELEWSTLELGEYVISVQYLFMNYDVTITVEDTTPPTGEGVEIETDYFTELTIEDCVTDIEDITEVSMSFVNEIDYTTGVSQEITVLLEDAAGNTTEVISTIIVIQDTIAPVIEGEDSYSYEVGSTISYKQLVTVTDDSEFDVELDIDNSEVDIDVAGEYTVIYTATDYAGNVTTKELIIELYEVVVEVPVSESSSSSSSDSSSSSSNEESSSSSSESSSSDSSSSSTSTTSQTIEEKAIEAANTLLASITTSSMSQEAKAIAIFDWCHDKISYNGVNNASSWQEAAYTGLTSRAGNCYTYYATARMLLTQAGITNMSIQSPDHYWNLVDVGDGWLHFDTTYSSDGVRICLWTDDELTAYFELGYKQRHDYDKSSYPDIN